MEFLRLRSEGKAKKRQRKNEGNQMDFATHRSAVKGKLTREEIYDYL